MLAYSCLLIVYVAMFTSTVCNLYTVLRPVIGPCLFTHVCWSYMLSCVRLLYVICTLRCVWWWTMFACSCLLAVYNVMCTSTVCNLYTVIRPVIGPCLLARVYWPYMLSCVRLLYVICTLCCVQWLDHVCLLVSADRICCHVYVFSM